MPDTPDTTEEQETEEGPTGLDLRAVLIRSSRHALARTCDCGEDLTTTGITRLAYTFRVCECGTPEYAHLVEQLWHLDCLRGSS